MTDAAVLAAIRPGADAYALDIMRATGLPSGSVYPSLVRLLRGGQVEVRWDAAGRCAYTPTGRSVPESVARRAGWEWWLPAVFLAVVTAYRSLVRPDAARLPDLGVYLGAIDGLRHGHSLYDFTSGAGAPFTYPPFAGLLFTPITLAPALWVQAAWTVATIGIVVGLGVLVSRTTAPGVAWLPPVLTAVLLWSAPVASNIRYGQVSVGLAALVTIDVLLLRGSRRHGVLIGLAAAVKLTPLLFIPMLWLAGRRRAAVMATATFAAAGGLAGLVLPGDSLRFWRAEMWNVNRLGHITSTGNQSLNGALLRFGIPDSVRSLLMLAVGGAVAAVALRRAAAFGRSGDWFAALVVTGAASVVASPVSWTHHQVWLVLAVLLPVGATIAMRRWWIGTVLLVMLLPITSLGSPLWSNARLVLAAVVACLVPIAVRTPSSTDRP
jgi:alpha-1,2-mannosyltransferase